MTAETRTTILNKSKQLFASNGYEGFSMRILAKESGVGLSSIYHFFKDKDVLLKELFNRINTELGTKRAKLPVRHSASEALYDRILFQFKNTEEVVFVLKYYLHFRPEFMKLDNGLLPPKAIQHIQEVLESGINSKEFYIKDLDIDSEAKVITHTINGFLLEYFPKIPKKNELKDVTMSIHTFIMRSLTNKEVDM